MDHSAVQSVSDESEHGPVSDAVVAWHSKKTIMPYDGGPTLNARGIRMPDLTPVRDGVIA